MWKEGSPEVPTGGNPRAIWSEDENPPVSASTPPGPPKQPSSAPATEHRGFRWGESLPLLILCGAFLALAFADRGIVGSDGRFPIWHLFLVLGAISGSGGVVLIATEEPTIAGETAGVPSDSIVLDRRTWESIQLQLTSVGQPVATPAERPGSATPKIGAPAAAAVAPRPGPAAGGSPSTRVAPQPVTSLPKRAPAPPTISTPESPTALPPAPEKPKPPTSETRPAAAAAPASGPPPVLSSRPAVPESPPPRDAETVEKEIASLLAELGTVPRRERGRSEGAGSLLRAPSGQEECASCGTTIDPTATRSECPTCQRNLCGTCYRKSVQLGNRGMCPTCSWKAIVNGSL